MALGERWNIYRHERDRRHSLKLFAVMIKRFRVRLQAFVLMDNHYHLLLELSEASVAKCLKRYERRLRTDEVEQRRRQQAAPSLDC